MTVIIRATTEEVKEFKYKILLHTHFSDGDWKYIATEMQNALPVGEDVEGGRVIITVTREGTREVSHMCVCRHPSVNSAPLGCECETRHIHPEYTLGVYFFRPTNQDGKILHIGRPNNLRVLMSGISVFEIKPDGSLTLVAYGPHENEELNAHDQWDGTVSGRSLCTLL